MRIMIFGRPGSGKSTFSLKLSQKLKLPLYHTDKYFFEAHWIERPFDEFMKDLEKITVQDQWIIEGNSLRSLEMRYKRADIALYFALPKGVCLWRMLKRRLGFKNPLILDRAPRCPEVLRLKLIQYAWSFETRVEETLQHLKRAYPQTKFIFITSDKEAQILLNTFE
jgi:adenylate kinase family enzyme